MKLNLDLEYGNVLELEHINYSKQKDEIANILINMEKKNEDYKIKEFSFKEQETLLQLDRVSMSYDKRRILNDISFKVNIYCGCFSVIRSIISIIG